MNRSPFKDAAYRTEYRRIPFLLRYATTLRLYAGFLPLVIRGSIQARLGLYGDAQWCASSLYILRLLERIGVQIEITGMDHLRKLTTPCVIVANHMGVLETVVLPIIIHPIRPMTFVVKQSLLEYPVFKHVMKARNPIAVGRINPREDYKTVLSQGKDRLNRGISVVVFPQRTRERTVEPSQFNSIGVKLAGTAEVPVVPLALLTDAWENGKYIKEFGRIDPGKKVHFSFGEPMWVSGRGNDVHKAAVDFIVSEIHGFETEYG